MTNETNKMTCAEFQAQLAEMIGAGGNIADNEHLKSCELCSALLADLETIAEAARQLFPVAEPSDKLWDQIEMAIKSDNGNGAESKADPPKKEDLKENLLPGKEGLPPGLTPVPE